MNLWERKDEIASNLSGGMKHRLSLACTLVLEPKLLLLDEPTVGVDPKLRVSFWNYFYRLVERGTTILITTHYMDEASRCSRVGLMSNGKLVAEGSPGELKERTKLDSLEDVFLQISGGAE